MQCPECKGTEFTIDICCVECGWSQNEYSAAAIILDEEKRPQRPSGFLASGSLKVSISSED